MDSQFRFWLSEHPNSPPIGVRFVGPLDNPRRAVDLDGSNVQRLVERGVLRNFDTNSGGTGSAVDALKGILKVPGSSTAPRPRPRRRHRLSPRRRLHRNLKMRERHHSRIDQQQDRPGLLVD